MYRDDELQTLNSIESKINHTSAQSQSAATKLIASKKKHHRILAYAFLISYKITLDIARVFARNRDSENRNQK
jgi:hypothetical protein